MRHPLLTFKSHLRYWIVLLSLRIFHISISYAPYYHCLSLFLDIIFTIRFRGCIVCNVQEFLGYLLLYNSLLLFYFEAHQVNYNYNKKKRMDKQVMIGLKSLQLPHQYNNRQFITAQNSIEKPYHWEIFGPKHCLNLR